jgi:hypothetical protein
MMLAGTALVLGLTLEILTPGGDLHWRSSRVEGGSATAVTADLLPVVNAAAVPPVAAVVHRAIPPPVHPAAVAHTSKPAVAADDRAGMVHFTVRTEGARVVVRRTDVPNAPEQVVREHALRLPAGHWVANATAPGYRNWTTYFSVTPSGQTNLLIRLRQAAPVERAHRRRRVVSARTRSHSRRRPS